MALFDILDSGEHIRARDEWFARLKAVFDGTYREPNAFALCGYVARTDVDAYKEPEKWVDGCLADIADRLENKIFNDFRFSPVCVEYGIYGVHYIDRMFGAKVFNNGDQWYNEYLKTPVGGLRMPDLEKDETFRLSIRAAKRFAEVGGAFPLYGLPTIASPLNIAINLYGEDILVSMLAEPEEARHDLEVIAELEARIHRAFREILPPSQLQPVVSWQRTQPWGFGQICGCSTHLISGELYRNMVADLDEKVLGVYENGGMIHLCGAHTQHIPTFRNMKTLRSLQLNNRASEDFEVYFNGLREDQIIYLNPTETMTPERAIRISGGKRLVIVSGKDIFYPVK